MLRYMHGTHAEMWCKAETKFSCSVCYRLNLGSGVVLNQSLFAGRPGCFVAGHGVTSQCGSVCMSLFIAQAVALARV